jgi:S-adenosylmethionine decarboxylase
VEKDYFFFDIFSCKPFDIDFVEQLVIKTFGVKSYERFMSERGRQFPRHISDKLVEGATEAIPSAVSV